MINNKADVFCLGDILYLDTLRQIQLAVHPTFPHRVKFSACYCT